MPPGGRAVAVIDFTMDLPEQWGRWGNHQGITYLLNWYPVLAHHDDRGWERTPFVPWHQPWYQEAGHYTVLVDLPADQVVAYRAGSPGDRTELTDGSGLPSRRARRVISRWFARTAFRPWSERWARPWFASTAFPKRR